MSNTTPSDTIKGSVGSGNSIYISKVVFKETSDQFPNVGNPNYLYIAKTEGLICCWEDGYIPLCSGGSSGGETGGESNINDMTISVFSTWSSKKIKAELDNVAVDIETATDEDIQGLF